ncbi:hypothetical protein NJB1907E90_28880 [Mycobacterium marinum]|nr:hypothetical protein NJB1907E90_28880 [Mycobacterium marinum]
MDVVDPCGPISHSGQRTDSGRSARRCALAHASEEQPAGTSGALEPLFTIVAWTSGGARSADGPGPTGTAVADELGGPAAAAAAAVSA